MRTDSLIKDQELHSPGYRGVYSYARYAMNLIHATGATINRSYPRGMDSHNFSGTVVFDQPGKSKVKKD